MRDVNEDNCKIHQSDFRVIDTLWPLKPQTLHAILAFFFFFLQMSASLEYYLGTTFSLEQVHFEDCTLNKSNFSSDVTRALEQKQVMN